MTSSPSAQTRHRSPGSFCQSPGCSRQTLKIAHAMVNDTSGTHAAQADRPRRRPVRRKLRVQIQHPLCWILPFPSVFRVIHRPTSAAGPPRRCLGRSLRLLEPLRHGASRFDHQRGQSLVRPLHRALSSFLQFVHDISHRSHGVHRRCVHADQDSARRLLLPGSLARFGLQQRESERRRARTHHWPRRSVSVRSPAESSSIGTSASAAGGLRPARVSIVLAQMLQNHGHRRLQDEFFGYFFHRPSSCVDCARSEHEAMPRQLPHPQHSAIGFPRPADPAGTTGQPRQLGHCARVAAAPGSRASSVHSSSAQGILPTRPRSSRSTVPADSGRWGSTSSRPSL